MFIDFVQVLLFFVIGIAFVTVNLVLSRLLQPRNKSQEKLIAYECGEDPQGPAWIQFNNRFYVVALIFLIFDAEVVFLFPWAVVFKKLGWVAFVDMMVFIGILLIGLAFVWVKGDLDWIKPHEKEARENG